MNAPVYVLPPALTVHGQPESPTAEIADLLRQLIALQQEQLTLLRNQQSQQDNSSKWRAFLTRWENEFPDIGAACKHAIPTLERAYLTLLRELTDRLSNDADALTDDFVLSEFLDRYAMRIAQLGNIISQLAPLADISSTEKG
ncbi:MAG: hypothetical protein RMJ56_06470 [Gemmataceae bacterium]|nr:hypothetical protein [Gemmata sp.]MDW8197234.1 hypothetical protein [Gemmataceae bacterium]